MWPNPCVSWISILAVLVYGSSTTVILPRSIVFDIADRIVWLHDQDEIGEWRIRVRDVEGYVADGIVSLDHQDEIVENRIRVRDSVEGSIPAHRKSELDCGFMTNNVRG